jgi:glucose/arabinose dehydrogenase/PKD repeat protein
VRDRFWRSSLALACLLLLALASAGRSDAVPVGFEDRLVASLSLPTALAFTPDGRLLIAEKVGRLRVYKAGALLATPALNLGSKACSNSERGLLGIAVDPAFSSSRYVYLFYTFNKYGSCENTSANRAVNRVSRFTLSDANVIDSSSERVLVDNIPSWGGNHNAGDLRFGKDGYLYVSVGDGGCDYAGDSGCGGSNDASRDQHVLIGKILRLTPGGGIPPGNPFQGADSARCNLTGRTDAGKKCQETYAWGLRNPFRIAFDPDAAGTRFYVNDVGQNLWEEVDLGQVGADYGWNVREGFCATGSTTNCGPAPAGMTNPLYAYGHSATGCASITGGAFVPDGAWPSSYDPAYLYGDYVCGKIFALTPTGGGLSRSEFTSAASIVAMAFGPYGGSRALFYTSLQSGGEVHRVAYTGTANRSPTAVAQASPTFGALPLVVSFDGRGSSDLDGDPLGYEWDFGDGSAKTTGATATHTYSSAGSYTARLTVRDGRGGVDSASVILQPGNNAPKPAIAAPAATKLFRVGETVTLNGSATDLEEGTLPEQALSWTVILHHGTHTHPFLGPVYGNNAAFRAPAPEDLSAAGNSYLEIRLTATDSQGLKATVRQDLRPHRVGLTLASTPTGLKLGANELTIVAPKTITSWEGFAVRLGAPSQVDGSGTFRTFAAWSDGGAGSHTVTTPAAATTYSATFRAASGTLFRDGFESGDFSRWASASGLFVQMQQVDTGAYAARGRSTGLPTFATKELATAQPDLLYRLRFKLVTKAPTSYVTLLRLRTATGSRIVSVTVGSGSVVTYRNDVSGVTRSSTTSVSLATWHTLSVHASVNGAAGKVEVWYDGARVGGLTQTEALGSTSTGRLQLGDDSTDRAYDVVFDGIAVDAPS